MRLIISGFSYRRPLFYWFCFMLSGLWSMMGFAMPKDISLDASCSYFEVKLPANPSTGFRWTLDAYDTEHFICVETEYVAATTARVGASGERIFYFKQKEGRGCPEFTLLHFSYARSWEVESSSSTKVTVQFKK